MRGDSGRVIGRSLGLGRPRCRWPRIARAIAEQALEQRPHVDRAWGRPGRGGRRRGVAHSVGQLRRRWAGRTDEGGWRGARRRRVAGPRAHGLGPPLEQRGERRPANRHAGPHPRTTDDIAPEHLRRSSASPAVPEVPRDLRDRRWPGASCQRAPTPGGWSSLQGSYRMVARRRVDSETAIAARELVGEVRCPASRSPTSSGSDTQLAWSPRRLPVRPKPSSGVGTWRSTHKQRRRRRPATGSSSTARCSSLRPGRRDTAGGVVRLAERLGFALPVLSHPRPAGPQF